MYTLTFDVYTLTYNPRSRLRVWVTRSCRLLSTPVQKYFLFRQLVHES